LDYLSKCYGFTIEGGVLLCHNIHSGSSEDLVILPEGIRVVAERAMAGFECRKLVMPASLVEIEKEGFKFAEIKEIDFGSCKLERMGYEAFRGCKAKTVLPDSLKIIDAWAATDLVISEGKKVRLPSNLSFICSHSINLENVREIEIDERAVKESTNFLGAIRSGLPNKLGRWVTVRVFRGDTVVNEFIITDFYEGWGCNFIKQDGIDYRRYDDNFDQLQDESCKFQMAVYRVSWPYDLPPERKAFYDSYACKEILKKKIGKGKIVLAECLGMLEKRILPQHLAEILVAASQKKNLEMSDCLLDLIRRNHGIAAKSLDLEL
jgi:hypothetical protein